MNSYKALGYFIKTLNCPVLKQSAGHQLIFSSNRVNVKQTRFCSCEKLLPEKSTEKESTDQQNLTPSVLDPVENIDLSDYGSAIQPKFNFAMYADKSPLTQKYIQLGVNLHEIEKKPEAAQYLVTLTIEKITPYINFLSKNHVPADKIGEVITKNPFIFKESLDDLEVRVNYLWSKKFDEQMIATIITKAPKWFSTPVKIIDERLGFLQQTFKLSGDQVREMITREPKLALVQKKYILTNIYTLKEEIGFETFALKNAVLKEPHLLRTSAYDLITTYEYLTQTMNVSLDLILKQPKVLLYRKFKLKDRHKFLESLGRAQYSHLLPGYVNIKDLVELSDSEFCEKVAKTSTDLFYEFVKTL